MGKAMNYNNTATLNVNLGGTYEGFRCKNWYTSATAPVQLSVSMSAVMQHFLSAYSVFTLTFLHMSPPYSDKEQ